MCCQPEIIANEEFAVRTFRPRVRDGARAAIDLEALMATAAVFEGYDSPAVTDGFASSPSIWDAALDILVAGL